MCQGAKLGSWKICIMLYTSTHNDISLSKNSFKECIFSRMRSKTSCFSSYIKLSQQVLFISKIAGYFSSRPRKGLKIIHIIYIYLASRRLENMVRFCLIACPMLENLSSILEFPITNNIFFLIINNYLI